MRPSRPRLPSRQTDKIPWPKDETGRAGALKILVRPDREATPADIAARLSASATSIAPKGASLATHGLIRQGERGYLG